MDLGAMELLSEDFKGTDKGLIALGVIEELSRRITNPMPWRAIQQVSMNLSSA